MYVFALLLFVGYGASRELVVEDMYFYRVDHCNAMASLLVKRYSSHGIAAKDRAVAYCVPKKIDTEKSSVY